jgi:hypothetical protein
MLYRFLTPLPAGSPELSAPERNFLKSFSAII